MKWRRGEDLMGRRSRNPEVRGEVVTRSRQHRHVQSSESNEEVPNSKNKRHSAAWRGLFWGNSKCQNDKVFT